MPAIKPVGEIAEKWGRVTPARADDYRKGVETPKKDWAGETLAAEGSYEAGVTAAIGNKLFGKGVRKAGTETWRKGATEKGVVRWPSGVSGAVDKYQANFSPFAEEIARIKLPPRRPKGDPANIDRVRVIADALHKKKVMG